MKVLGRSSKTTFIVEISATDMAHLYGEPGDYHPASVLRADSTAPVQLTPEKMTAGDVVDIGGIYDQAREIVSSFSEFSKSLASTKGNITRLQSAVSDAQTKGGAK